MEIPDYRYFGPLGIILKIYFNFWEVATSANNLIQNQNLAPWQMGHCISIRVGDVRDFPRIKRLPKYILLLLSVVFINMLITENHIDKITGFKSSYKSELEQIHFLNNYPSLDFCQLFYSQKSH